jgi:hypothetical protein
MNTLKSVFWDYPQFTDEGYLRQVLEECRAKSDLRFYLWIMRRFLEYGRVVDTLQFFSIDEIAKHLGTIRLRKYTAKKWRRMVEVYGAA